jgi:hypothetical protein
MQKGINTKTGSDTKSPFKEVFQLEADQRLPSANVSRRRISSFIVTVIMSPYIFLLSLVVSYIP